MTYDQIINKLKAAGRDDIADSVTLTMAAWANSKLGDYDGNQLAALATAKRDFVATVSFFLSHTEADIDPETVLRQGSSLYAAGWAVAQVIHRLDWDGDEELNSDRTEIPDAFLLGLIKVNNDLSTKVLEVVAKMEKATRADALLREYEQLDELMERLGAPKFNELGTRSLSVIERVEALAVDYQEQLEVARGKASSGS